MKVLVTALLLSLPVTVLASAQLAQKNNCMACHAVDKKLVGPSFKDIAAKYKGDPTAQEKLIAKVRKGGAGVWGPIPMPSHPSTNQAELEAITKWILAQ